MKIDRIYKINKIRRKKGSLGIAGTSTISCDLNPRRP
jgi:hypothetical protein